MRLALVAFLALAIACGRATAPPPHLVPTVVRAELAPGEDEVSMEIIELMCRPCATRIVGDAKRLPGVTAVHMELATKTLTVVFDTSLTGRARIVASVEDIVGHIQ